MRLTREEKRVIVDAVKKVDPDAIVYLFGSRVDDAKSGGDIDLLIFSSGISFDEKLQIKKEIFNALDEQKLDLVISNDLKDPFVQLALETGVKLHE